jgi:hypothetical protein
MTIFVEGMIQEKLRFPFAEDRFIWGDGGVFEIQIPPGAAAATNVLPSAEHARAVHFCGGTLFDTHVKGRKSIFGGFGFGVRE